MHYLIDGHNLIGRMPDISLADPNDEIKLVMRLKSWAAAGRRRRVTVVFDGGLPGGHAVNFSSSVVKVLFASEQSSADALLLRRIDRMKNPREHTIISSDQQVIAAAEARGVPFRRSEEFAAELAPEEGQQKRFPREEVAPDKAVEPVIDAKELKEWLELFGPENHASAEEATPDQEISTKETFSPREKPTGRNVLSIDKDAREKLSDKEVEDWLQLFNKGDD